MYYVIEEEFITLDPLGGAKGGFDCLNMKLKIIKNTLGYKVKMNELVMF
jgi:hypothetical protein